MSRKKGKNFFLHSDLTRVCSKKIDTKDDNHADDSTGGEIFGQMNQMRQMHMFHGNDKKERKVLVVSQGDLELKRGK